MAPQTRSTPAPSEILITTQAKKARPAKSTLVASQALDNDLDRTSDHPTKSARLAREEKLVLSR